MAKKKRNTWKAAQRRSQQKLGGPTHVQTTQESVDLARLGLGSAADAFPAPGGGTDTSRYTSILPVQDPSVRRSRPVPGADAMDALNHVARGGAQDAYAMAARASAGTKVAAVSRIAEGLTQTGRTYAWDDEVVATRLGIVDSTIDSVNADDMARYIGDDRADEFRAIQGEIRSATNEQDRIDAKGRALSIVMDAYELAKADRDRVSERLDSLQAQRSGVEALIHARVSGRGRATELDALQALGVR